MPGLHAQGKPMLLKEVAPGVWQLRTQNPYLIEVSRKSTTGYVGVNKHPRPSTDGKDRFDYAFGWGLPHGKPITNKWGMLFRSAAQAAAHMAEHKNLLVAAGYHYGGKVERLHPPPLALL